MTPIQFGWALPAGPRSEAERPLFLAQIRQALDAQAAELERACAEIGRDPATLRRTWFGPCACAPTEEAATKLAAGRFTSANCFLGTPAQVVEQMRPFIELGVDYFMLGCAGFPDLTSLELLRNEVLPALNEGRI